LLHEVIEVGDLFQQIGSVGVHFFQERAAVHNLAAWCGKGNFRCRGRVWFRFDAKQISGRVSPHCTADHAPRR
jgi:hypothetical protein